MSILDMRENQANQDTKTHLEILLDAYDAIGITYAKLVKDDYTYIQIVAPRNHLTTNVDMGDAFKEFAPDGSIASY